MQSHRTSSKIPSRLSRKPMSVRQRLPEFPEISVLKNCLMTVILLMVILFPATASQDLSTSPTRIARTVYAV